jgi:N-acetylglucosamine-6-phosphate deacetylase
MPTQVDFLISGPTLFPDGSVAQANLAITGGLIRELTPGRDRRADVVTEGLILPGFIDLQVNGAYGDDFTTDGAGVAAVAARLPATGVTAFLPTVITSLFTDYPQRIREVAGACQGASGARPLGLHLEGPYLNPIRKGAHNPDLLRPIQAAEMKVWAAAPVVKMVTLAPELPGAIEAIGMLRSRGILVSAGHSEATWAEAWAGFEAGIQCGTHLFNAMRPLHHREPGIAGALLSSTLPCGLIADGVHVHAGMIDLAYRLKGSKGIYLVTDVMEAFGKPPGRYRLADREVWVREDRVQLADGTLAGSLLRMDAAFRNVLHFTGCTIAEASAMTARTPARLMGLKNKGVLAAGCDADITVLDEGMSVTHTIVAGELAYEKLWN